MKYLIVKGSGGGGLGDSIRSVLVGILYAKASGRSLYVDWSHGNFGPEFVNVFPDFFTIRNLQIVDILPDSASVYPPAWEGRLDYSLDKIYREDGNPPWDRQQTIARYSFDMSRIDYPQDVLVMWEFDQLDKLRGHLDPEMRAAPAINVLGDIYNNFITVNNAISDQVNKATGESFVSSTIGMHLRMTNEFARNKGSVSLKKYFKALDNILDKIPEASIFLATDNLDCLKLIKARYKNVFTREKWFSVPGDPLHLNQSCPDRLTSTQDALVEMLLLSRCAHLICPDNSSFSLVARIIAPGEKQNVITISPGVNSPNSMFNRMVRLWSDS